MSVPKEGFRSMKSELFRRINPRYRLILSDRSYQRESRGLVTPVTYLTCFGLAQPSMQPTVILVPALKDVQ